MHFIIDWASLIAGSKFAVFALFYFVFEGSFPSTSPMGAYIWRGDLMEGFLRYWFRGAYILRGLYMERLIFGILRYHIHFEITGDPWNLIGSRQCDLFTIHTIFSSKPHIS